MSVCPPAISMMSFVPMDPDFILSVFCLSRFHQRLLCGTIRLFFLQKLLLTKSPFSLEVQRLQVPVEGCYQTRIVHSRAHFTALFDLVRAVTRSSPDYLCGSMVFFWSVTLSIQHTCDDLLLHHCLYPVFAPGRCLDTHLHCTQICGSEQTYYRSCFADNSQTFASISQSTAQWLETSPGPHSCI